VFPALAVEGTLRHLDTPDDVIGLMTAGASGVVALVREAGATFLAPIFHELAAVVCLSGTPRSHIGIVSREFRTPCLVGVEFDEGASPSDGTRVRVDCTQGVVTWS
jgi:phosphohistidine swiveling domain-containing protein